MAEIEYQLLLSIPHPELNQYNNENAHLSFASHDNNNRTLDL